MQLINIFSIVLGTIVTSVILFVSVYDSSYCFLEGSTSSSIINSYFLGKKGYYVQIDTSEQNFPDFFQLFELKQKYGDAAIVYSSNTKQWVILKNKDILYYTPSQESNDSSSTIPPSQGWLGLNSSVSGLSVISLSCHGELSPRATSNQVSNIQMIFNNHLF
jgi:ABC-type microcin C transport system permease subunit YejE